MLHAAATNALHPQPDSNHSHALLDAVLLLAGKLLPPPGLGRRDLEALKITCPCLSLLVIQQLLLVVVVMELLLELCGVWWLELCGSWERGCGCGGEGVEFGICGPGLCTEALGSVSSVPLGGEGGGGGGTCAAVLGGAAWKRSCWWDLFADVCFESWERAFEGPQRAAIFFFVYCFSFFGLSLGGWVVCFGVVWGVEKRSDRGMEELQARWRWNLPLPQPNKEQAATSACAHRATPDNPPSHIPSRQPSGRPSHRGGVLAGAEIY